MKKILLTFSFSALLLSACTKDEHAINDVQSPAIQLFSPVEGSVFSIGDTVRIKGNITDNNDLHEACVTVSCPDHLTTKMKCDMHVHGMKQHSFDTSYVVTAEDADHGLKLLIEAEDHSKNKNEKVMIFDVH